jgi:DpnII restriction endonuclease
MDWQKYPTRYWHCYVALAGQRRDREKAVLNDATFDQIRTEIVEPWLNRRSFTVSGTVVRNRDAATEIRIVYTPEPQRYYVDKHNAKMRASNIADLATDRRLLPFDAGLDYTNELLFASTGDKIEQPEPDLGLILQLCRRLPYTARILATRDREKSPYQIKDEYDVQDLLHAVLRAYLKYSVQEEPLGKVGGVRSSRADIAIEDLGILIEIKYAHGPKDQTRLVEEFAQDLLLYTKWAPLRSFVYFVYNAGDLRDPEALEELGGETEIRGRKFRTYVILPGAI